jgi:positive regulator of sigma E activity
MERIKNNECIEHAGIVQEADDHSVKVKISADSACSGCHAEGICNLSGKKEKIIQINGVYNLTPGENVSVVMKQSMGYTALFLGYIIPLFVVMFILIVLISFAVAELTAGLMSLAILSLYYLILYYFRNRINKKFSFTIKT